MIALLGPGPLPPGYEPPHVSIWGILGGMAFVFLWLLAGICLAELQGKRQNKKRERDEHPGDETQPGIHANKHE